MEELFDEIKIRQELKRLDQITGLNGALLPIKFGKAKGTLGSFSYTSKDSLEFYFSTYYFLDPGFPVEEKLYVIRHEYAHYMDYMINGFSSHGPQWKKCCIKIGAFPIRCFNQGRANSFMEKHKKENIKNQALDEYQPELIIMHPRYGKGTITEINGKGLSRIAIVTFAEEINKKLSLIWISENCQIISPLNSTHNNVIK